MPLTFQCPECDHTITVPSKLAGQRGKCPKCKESCIVPKEESSSSPSKQIPLVTEAVISCTSIFLGGLAFVAPPISGIALAILGSFVACVGGFRRFSTIALLGFLICVVAGLISGVHLVQLNEAQEQIKKAVNLL